MPKLIVTVRELRYARKDYPKGAQFEATEKDAKILKAIKKAADAPVFTEPMREVATVQAPEPEPVSEPEEVAEDPKPTRSYRTRRMTAED